jgi:hypothetical protein
LLSPAALERVKATAMALALSPDAASKVLEHTHAEVAAYQQEAMAKLAATTQGWVETIKADPELGGADYAGKMALAQRAFNRFADPELAKACQETGFGNHPGHVRAWYRVGLMMREDQIIRGGPAAAGQKSAEERLYDQTPAPVATP